ncbi:hypothetical protein [Lachnospira multipara]|uniref:hypothetical protein n=1 Tax=Lachnospira multipara TaxID=28051 RepID=UPI0004885EF7|nr:hypothetical protein [Lachnospira multipara]
MDKYEFNIKMEQVRKLAAKKEYEEAARIAKDLNWLKCKDWQALATAINVFEAIEDYDEARDMAILAYNRNLGGKKLIYKLVELNIKIGDYEEADELYEEYAHVAHRDVDKYVLLYELRHAENASDNELVEILEEYKEHEIDEKYMYELAKLYFKTDRKDECIKTCDNIVLWFQDGDYVEMAVSLKNELGAELTNTQKKIFDNAMAKKSDINLEKQFEETKELVKIKKDEVGEVLDNDEKEAVFDKAVSDIIKKEEDEKASIEASKKLEEITALHKEPVSKKVDDVPTISAPGKDGPNTDIIETNDSEEIKEFVMRALEKDKQENNETEVKEQKVRRDDKESPVVTKPELDVTPSIQGASSMESSIDKANLSLKELIENAKKQIENNIDQINKEDEEEERKETQARIEENVKNFDTVVPEYDINNTQNLQTEIAKNISGYINEEDKEFSPAQSETADVSFMKTGELEPEEVQLESKTNSEEETTGLDDQIEGQLSLMDWIESVKEEKFADKEKDGVENKMGEDIQKESVKVLQTEEITDEVKEDLVKESVEESTNEVEERTDIIEEMKKSIDEMDLEEEDGGRKLDPELAKIFRKYKDMPGLEEQLVDFFEGLQGEMNMTNSVKGNILLSGNTSADKLDLARAIVRAINHLYPDAPKKIAKTTGDSINARGITKAMAKLRGTVLIIEGAGTIQPKRINEILNCLEQDTGRMIVILEDSDAEMNVLVNFNPELTNTFNHRIVLKQYNVNELVEMAKRFAKKRQYEVHDDALLELYLKIDKLKNVNDNIKLDDIKEIINNAILNSERRASRKFFGALKKKKSTDGNMIYLTESDFKD